MEARSGYELPGENPDTTAWVKRCGFVTVAHAIVEWGPLLVVDRPSQSPDKPCVTILPRGMAMLWSRDGRSISESHGDIVLHAWTPDVDPASLVGQYALGGKVVA